MTPYEVLGITPDATKEEIQEAYRRARRRAHPDHGGTPEAFLAVQDAYDKVMKLSPCGNPKCDGKGFIREKSGAFIYRRLCPNCWPNLKR